MQCSGGGVQAVPAAKHSPSGRAVFFSKSRLTLQQWLIIIHWWMREYPSGQAAEEAKVAAETAGQIYQWLREVCTTTLLATPIQLGGPGTV